MALHELPPPSSGTLLELQFRRLLQRCEDALLNTEDSVTSGKLSDPKYHYFVDALQEQLADLQDSAAKGLSPSSLELYQDHVQALVRAMRPVHAPAFCSKVAQQDKVLRPRGKSCTPTPTIFNTSQATRPVQVPATFTTPSPIPTTARRQPTTPRTADVFMSTETRSRLDLHHNLQEELASELLDMTSTMKESARKLGSAIRHRGQVLDEAEVALVASADNTAKSVAQVGQQFRQSSWGLCQVLMMLLVVSLVLVGMFVYIKTSYLLGYRGRA